MTTFSLIDRLWKRLKHYSGRENPWIKLHHDLVSEIDFQSLPDKSKYHLIAIMMQSARNRNIIPNEPKAIRKAIGATTKVDLEALVNAGYLVINEASTEAGGAENTSTALAEEESESLAPLRVDKDKEEDKETPITPLSEPQVADQTESAGAKIPEKPKKQSANGLLTYKKRRLSGQKLDDFLRFWDAFGDKRGKPKAADSWIDIPDRDDGITEEIIAGAFRYVSERNEILDRNGTPKMAQGWLSERRWEDAPPPTRQVAGSTPSTTPPIQELETEPLTAEEQGFAAKAMAALKKETDEESFGLWFKPTQIVRLKGGNLAIRCPSDQARNWLASHYGDTIIIAMRGAGFVDWELSVVIGTVTDQIKY